MSKMSEFPVITDPAGFFVPLFTPESGGLNRRGLMQKLGLPFSLAQSAVAVTHTGSTAEVVFANVTVPAGAMGPNGILRVNTLWTMTSSANVKTPRVRLGGVSGTEFYSQTQTTTLTLRHQTEIMNRNNQASQVAFPSIAGGGGWSSSAQARTIGSINTAVDTILVISGQLASAGETITLEAYNIEVLYKE
jgi:hypothetical protein